MSLFPPTATLKVLLLWAGGRRKEFAVAIRDALLESAPDGVAISIINESHESAVYDELSEDAIRDADCILMIASEADFRTHRSAVREWQFFNVLVRESQKIDNQFRFVRVAGEACPRYPNSGSRMLSFRDPKAPTPYEIQTAYDYFWTAKSQMPLLNVKLSAETLLKPGGELAATLWAATLDESTLETASADPEVTPAVQLLQALHHLKALHSIHCGLGAMLKGPMEALQQDLSPGQCDFDRIRKLMVNGLSEFQQPLPSRLEMALRDCISSGLIPTLKMLALRLAGMPAYSRELQFVEAAIERLTDVIVDRGAAPRDFSQHDGRWWVEHYQRIMALVQKRFHVIITDIEGADLLSPGETSAPSERRFGQTLNVSRNLLASTIQLTFLVLVVFSFLHAHERVKDPDIVPEHVEDALEQLAQDWRCDHLTDAVVKWSNQMILCLLAAFSQEGGEKSAAA